MANIVERLGQNPARRRLPGRSSGRGIAARRAYRIAVCIFEDAALALRGIGILHQYGIGTSDLVVFTASAGPAEAILSLAPPQPAIFVRSGSGNDFGWEHIGPSASHMTRKVARLSLWASDRTIDEIQTELSKGRVVLLIYGLRSAIHSLAAGFLDLPVLRLDLHDVPAWIDLDRGQGHST